MAASNRGLACRPRLEPRGEGHCCAGKSQAGRRLRQAGDLPGLGPARRSLCELARCGGGFDAKFRYMQKNGRKTLDVVGGASGKLILDGAKAMRHRHGDLPALGVKSVQIKSPRVRLDHLPPTQLQVARLDVPRLDQPRFIPCLFRP
jgi:hypothetical protein